MAALRSSRYIDKTGLYFLQPYDPDRIPLVFVHGLVSSPFTWVETINGLQADPEMRKRYQFWVFAYPTGTPILYSALRLREELAKVDKLYPNHRPYVVVGFGGSHNDFSEVRYPAMSMQGAAGDRRNCSMCILRSSESVISDGYGSAASTFSIYAAVTQLL
jgi:hypothetical protein